MGKIMVLLLLFVGLITQAQEDIYFAQSYNVEDTTEFYTLSSVKRESEIKKVYSLLETKRLILEDTIKIGEFAIGFDSTDLQKIRKGLQEIIMYATTLEEIGYYSTKKKKELLFYKSYQSNEYSKTYYLKLKNNMLLIPCKKGFIYADEKKLISLIKKTQKYDLLHFSFGKMECEMISEKEKETEIIEILDFGIESFIMKIKEKIFIFEIKSFL